jgi:hypothetical protein
MDERKDKPVIIDERKDELNVMGEAQTGYDLYGRLRRTWRAVMGWCCCLARTAKSYRGFQTTNNRMEISGHQRLEALKALPGDNLQRLRVPGECHDAGLGQAREA